jgi:hypothetical protein
MPLSLFTDRVRTGAYLARFCFIGAMITYFLFVSQYLQDVQGWTALQAGLAADDHGQLSGRGRGPPPHFENGRRPDDGRRTRAERS